MARATWTTRAARRDWGFSPKYGLESGLLGLPHPDDPEPLHEGVKTAPPLLRALRRRLAAAGTRKRAEGARAYMKSAMPFHGVDVKTLRAICREVFARHPVASAAAWRRDVLAIWRGAQFREERYAAIELTGTAARAASRRWHPFRCTKR